jgi:hypothetical protein
MLEHRWQKLLALQFLDMVSTACFADSAVSRHLQSQFVIPREHLEPFPNPTDSLQ